jgi:dihydrofolate reductase
MDRRRLAMSKVVLDVAMSLDGFTAGPDIGEANPLGRAASGCTSGFSPVKAMVGGAIIGRRTFDLGVGPCGGTPWPGVPSFVVTHRTREDLPGDNGGTFAFDGLEAAARRAGDAAGGKDVLVLGAHVAGQLLRAGLLDEVRIHLVPLLLGEGTPLFAGERGELIPEGKPVAGAVTHLRYRVAKP